MTESEGPHERDAVYFGPGKDAPDDRSSSPASDTPGPEAVDTWFVERADEEEQPAPRLHRVLTVVDRNQTSVLVGLGSVTAIALIVAALGWATGGTSTVTATQQSSSESHGLTADQAACFAFSRIEGRVKAVLGSESPIGIGPARHTVATEITSLDGLGAAYPSADYRLIANFADVADASVRMSNEPDARRFQDLIVERFTYLKQAREGCREIAAFDTDAAAPLAPGD